MTHHADHRRPIENTSLRPRFHRPARVVLLAADAQPTDRATVDRAIAIAAREGSKLVALHILPGDHGSQLRDADGPVPLELERIVDRARQAGVDARQIVRYGEVGRETLRAAGELDADLIVVGAQSWVWVSLETQRSSHRRDSPVGAGWPGLG